MQFPFDNLQASKPLNRARPDRSGGGSVYPFITAVRIVTQINADAITPEGIGPCVSPQRARTIP